MTYRTISQLTGEINEEEVAAELMIEWERLTEREEILEFHYDRLDQAEMEVGTSNIILLELVEINLELEHTRHLIMESAAKILEQVRKHRDLESETISEYVEPTYLED